MYETQEKSEDDNLTILIVLYADKDERVVKCFYIKGKDNLFVICIYCHKELKREVERDVLEMKLNEEIK